MTFSFMAWNYPPWLFIVFQDAFDWGDSTLWLSIGFERGCAVNEGLGTLDQPAESGYGKMVRCLPRLWCSRKKVGLTFLVLWKIWWPKIMIYGWRRSVANLAPFSGKSRPLFSKVTFQGPQRAFIKGRLRGTANPSLPHKILHCRICIWGFNCTASRSSIFCYYLQPYSIFWKLARFGVLRLSHCGIYDGRSFCTLFSLISQSYLGSESACLCETFSTF